MYFIIVKKKHFKLAVYDKPVRHITSYKTPTMTTLEELNQIVRSAPLKLRVLKERRSIQSNQKVEISGREYVPVLISRKLI